MNQPSKDLGLGKLLHLTNTTAWQSQQIMNFKGTWGRESWKLRLVTDLGWQWVDQFQREQWWVMSTRTKEGAEGSKHELEHETRTTIGWFSVQENNNPQIEPFLTWPLVVWKMRSDKSNVLRTFALWSATNKNNKNKWFRGAQQGKSPPNKLIWKAKNRNSVDTWTSHCYPRMPRRRGNVGGLPATYLEDPAERARRTLLCRLPGSLSRILALLWCLCTLCRWKKVLSASVNDNDVNR